MESLNLVNYGKFINKTNIVLHYAICLSEIILGTKRLPHNSKLGQKQKPVAVQRVLLLNADYFNPNVILSQSFASSNQITFLLTFESK